MSQQNNEPTLQDFLSDANLPQTANEVDIAKSILYLLMSYGMESEEGNRLLLMCADTYATVWEQFSEYNADAE